MKEGNELYRAFVVRCWRDDIPPVEARAEPERAAAPAEGPHSASHDWHFVVTEITHEQRPHGLPSLDALIAYLQTVLTDGT